MVVKPVEQLKKQILELEEANASLKDGIEQLKAEKRELEVQAAEDKAVIKKLQSVKKKNKEVESECNRLESEVLSAAAAMQTLRTGELQDIQNKLKSTAIALGTVNNKCKIYENEVGSLRKKLQSTTEELAKADTEKTQLVYEKQDLQINLETAIKNQEMRRENTQDNLSPSFLEYIKMKRELRETVEDKQKLEQGIEKVSPRRKPERKYLKDS